MQRWARTHTHLFQSDTSPEVHGPPTRGGRKAALPSRCVGCVCDGFAFSQSANAMSIPGSSRTALSRLRQLETITLNQQTSAHFHHTKKPCAHSANWLCQQSCVFWVVFFFFFFSPVSQHDLFFSFPGILFASRPFSVPSLEFIFCSYTSPDPAQM